MMVTFIHLRLHTEFSLCDGLIRVPQLVTALSELGMPACAITDHANLFATVKYFKAMVSKGLKPIIGCDLLTIDPQTEQRQRLTLLCQNLTGYQNLSVLLTRAYQKYHHQGEVMVPFSAMTLENCQGLIALCGGPEGRLAESLQSGQSGLAAKQCQRWQALFPERFYLEISRTGRAFEEEYLQAVLPLAAELKIPLVATNAVCFLKRDDFDAHEARVAIAEGVTLSDPNRTQKFSPEQYLRSPQEMAELFVDIPSSLENTVNIAKRCNFQLDLKSTLLPNFPLSEGITPEAFLKSAAEQGLATRPVPAAKQAEYQARLQSELEMINRMGFAGYFLIVADFINWSKQNKIPVGPGRGSGAGSLVAYALGITGLDPLPYDLLFERFLNPERVSMPDFDIDFCMDRRDEVITYVAERYGRASVAQIITFGTMAAKAVVRDVGRVLSHPYGFVDKVAKLIPFELGITLDKALAQEQLLQERYEQEEEVRQLIDLAKKLEGITRNAGKHAGGVVIAPRPLTEFTPLYCEENGDSSVTQYDKNDVEAIGLVKFDFLGLRTLTIIDWALNTINQQRATQQLPAIDINNLPLNDAATYRLLKSSQTTAIFQLESRGMKELIKRLQPDCFEDIIALVALFRPGPLQSGMVDDFIDRKQGKAEVEYPHPLLESVLRPTYGIIVYQEQVMQIAQVLAGYSLGAADLLRRAMGKKKPSEMAKQRSIFIQGAIDRDVPEATAAAIFDLMEKFADYGFNKSHSAAYALVTYQTAWLKAHYAAAFMAAVLSSDMDNTDKVVGFLEECHSQQLIVKVPNLNSSFYHFTISDEKTILYGLGAIKGVGESVCQYLIALREKEGPFLDLFSFCARIDLHKINRRVFEALIRSGSMDCFGQTRATLLASLDKAIKTAERNHQNNLSGQMDLFQMAAAPVASAADYLVLPELNDEIRLKGEKETLGHYISGHPLDRYRDELAFLVRKKIRDIRPTEQQALLIAGFIVNIKTIFSKRGDRIAFMTIDDGTGRLEVGVFAEAYQAYRHLLNKDQLVLVEGDITIDEYSGNCRISCKRLMTMEQARAARAERVLLSIQEGDVTPQFIQNLQAHLLPFKNGHCPVAITYQRDAVSAVVELGNDWRVQPQDELLTMLRELLGQQSVTIQYCL